VRRIYQLLALVIWSTLVFADGHMFREYWLLRSSYITTKPLILSSTLPNQDGRLPAGTTVYSVGGPDEQPRFVVFIGTKELSSMRATPPQHWLEVSPITAFSE
jgi:hypothetical protein